MKKKSVALILCVCMLLTAFTGCSKQEASTSESTASESAASESTAETSTENADASEEKELITIEWLGFGKPNWNTNFNDFQKDSDLYKEFVKKTGVELDVQGLDSEQAQVRIASGDLGDLVTVDTVDQLTAMVESDLLWPLNDLVEQYAPELKTDYPTRWAKAQEYMENEEGLVYCLPIFAGNEGFYATLGRYLYTVRWDLYRDLGYPEMKTPEDLIEVFADMMELQPTTEDGRKVYGTGFYLTDSSFWGMTGNMQGTYGYVNEKGHYVTRNVQTDEICYDMIDEDGPYWRAVEYFYKANRAGVLDPDSFTQQASDWEAKIDSGEYLTRILVDQDYEYAQLEKDPTSTAGFASIPVEGCMAFQNGYAAGGWSSYMLAIPKTCENPERVIELLAFTFSGEGSRMLTSGVEGIHWNYVDGVPTYTQETFDLSVTGGEAWKKTGIYLSPLNYLTGIATCEKAEDGYYIDLTKEADYLSRYEFTPALEEYCEYYDVDFPNQVFLEWVEEGKMYDLSIEDKRYTINQADEDISRIDTACMKIAIEAVPKLVTAADDAAFEAVKAETLKALEAAGAYEAKAYYVEQFETNKAKYVTE